ncbi:MAG: hypothetical protein A3G20_07365 [Acidobacteria bacterium RIFCSPLOWO2_12_FULL_59_11]|nr:MAG: hypothetical protein A3G20_07365 [Acidobacteria bacterium RIFCSPLOWO2_12_FULL_59_11]
MSRFCCWGDFFENPPPEEDPGLLRRPANRLCGGVFSPSGVTFPAFASSPMLPGKRLPPETSGLLPQLLLTPGSLPNADS